MYCHWPFFRASVDNAVLALAKTNLAIAHSYFQLVGEPSQQEPVASLIVEEYHRCCDATAVLTGQPRLLNDVSWLQVSIDRRSPYVDALNLLQIDLLRRMRADTGEMTPESDERRHLVRLTIQGVAAGMRSTG